MKFWLKAIFQTLRMSTCLTFTNSGQSDKLNLAIIVTGATLITYTTYSFINDGTVQAYHTKHREKNMAGGQLSYRERRFLRFASKEYNGEVYMSPRDFLESMLHRHPKPITKRKQLTDSDVDHIKENTPNISQNSSKLFRSLGYKGIISYPEYLFLLSILTKSRARCRIAFAMLDIDGNSCVDKNEFLVVERIVNSVWKAKNNLANVGYSPKSEDEEANLATTSLLVHLFGPDGNLKLSFKEFNKFIVNLQTELLELEFNEFSQGLPSISEADFVKNLLRYSCIDDEIFNRLLDRLTDRLEETNSSISFEEYREFLLFLNNLEDFSFVMRFYTISDYLVTKKEFKRAVRVCTGSNLSKTIVDAVFFIVDEDEDGFLSYNRLMDVMKQRQSRKFKACYRSKGLRSLKRCVQRELYNYMNNFIDKP